MTLPSRKCVCRGLKTLFFTLPIVYDSRNDSLRSSARDLSRSEREKSNRLAGFFFCFRHVNMKGKALRHAQLCTYGTARAAGQLTVIFFGALKVRKKITVFVSISGYETRLWPAIKQDLANEKNASATICKKKSCKR